MGIFSSKHDGSLKSVVEPFAFLYKTANQHHQKTNLNRYCDLYFAKLTPKKSTKKALIFCHGNCMTVDRNFCDKMQMLSNYLDMAIYLPEYPGYGEAYQLGTPRAETCVQSLEKMVEYVSIFDNLGTKDIYLVGHSVGTGVVAKYASMNKEKFGGIILISPYKSIMSVVTDMSISSSFDFYKTKNVIHEIDAPICLIHGTHDEVINVSHSDELWKKLNKKYTNVYHKMEGLDHNYIIEHPECWNAIHSFIKN